MGALKTERETKADISKMELLHMEGGKLKEESIKCTTDRYTA